MTRIEIGGGRAEEPRRKRGKVATALGWDALAGAAGRVAGSASGAAERVSGLARSVFSRSQGGVAVPEDVGDPAERFREAARLNRRSEADLRAIQDNTCRGFYLYAVLLAVAAAAGIASLRYAPAAGFEPLAIAIRFVLVPVLLAMAIKYGYVNWIVRRQRLDGFWTYLASANWLPARFRKDGI